MNEASPIPNDVEVYNDMNARQREQTRNIMHNYIVGLDREIQSARRAIEETKYADRYDASVAYFKKYGKWDWDVRKAFIAGLKAKDMPYEMYSHGGSGQPFYAFAYINGLCRGCSPESLEDFKPTLMRSMIVERSNIALSKEDFQALTVTEEIRDAFVAQRAHVKQVEKDADYDPGYGFKFTKNPVIMSEWDGSYDVTIMDLPLCTSTATKDK
jgi:hypothetical protein